MKLMKKWISVLLVLCLVLPVAPLHAHAEEEIVIQQTETVTFKNPVYRNAGKVDVTFQPRQTLSTPYAPEDFLTDISAAGAVLREGMVNRQETITVLVQAGVDVAYELLAGSILDAAFVHTGVPNEGDYLYMQWDNINCPADYYVMDDTAYYIIYFMVAYSTTAEQEAQVDAAVAQLQSDLGLNGLGDYEALCAVYDWMCANITYDYANLNDDSYTLKYTAYAALINRTSVCQGYAVLLYRLMLEQGIDCRVITGYGNGEAHAWNIVELDGVYYNLDATWDATHAQAGVGYEYFLRSDANFTDHSRDEYYATADFYAAYPMAESDYSIEHLHSYTAAVTEPTCTEAGFTTYTCDCGYSYVTDHVEALGHTPGETSCTEQVFCTRCGEVCAEAGAHEYVSEWTPGGADVHWHECANCDGHSEPEAHTPNVSAATNETAQFCTVCGYVIQEQVPAGTVTVVAEGLWDFGPVKWKITSDGVLTISGKRSIQEKSEYIWKDYSDIITRIVLEDGITNVPKDGFSGMENVTSVYLSKKITYIGESAFKGCDKLTEVSIPASVTEIRKSAFYDCGSLAKLTFEEGSTLNKIWDYAFSGTAITELTTPESLTVINGYAFQNCTSLQDVHLTDGIQEVLYYAFDGCSGLKNIYLPESLENVGGHAFDGCYAIEKLEIYSPATFDGFPNRKALKTLVMARAATRIGSSFFENCTALTDVTLGDNIEVIESYAFNGCTSLTTLKLPEKITAIKTRTFANTGLISLTIPAAVTEVEMFAFENSTIKEITFLGDAPTFVMNSFSGVTATVIYPGDNATWTEAVLQNYGGNITWVSSTGHTHKYTVVTVDPTCTEAGSMTYTCECGYSYTKALDALGHDLTTATCITPAACQREGCSFTSETLGDHNYAAEITDPTCTEQGYMTFTCTYCGDSYKDYYTDPLGHSWGTGVVSGNEKIYTCAYCGETKAEAFDPAGAELPFHEWELAVLALTNKERAAYDLDPLTGFAAIQSACDVRAEEIVGYFSHTRPNGTDCFTALDEAGISCSYAGENIAAGQTTPAAVMNAWMNSDGHRANILTPEFKHMGVGYVYDATAMYRHYWVQMFASYWNESYSSFHLVTPEGTQFPAGTSIDDMGIYAVMENNVYGTCYLPIISEYCAGFDADAEGSQTVTVSALGFTATFEVTREAATREHVYGEWYVSVEPTCTEKGEERRDCTDCDLFETREVAAKGHSYEAVVTAPTCTEKGYTTHTCAACGDSYTDSETKQTGHAYTTEITKQATCTEPGVMTYTCANDGCTYSFTEEFDAKGHTEVTDAAVAPSCTATGLTEGKHCEICGAVTVAQTVVPAAEHTPKDAVEENRKEATCETDGSYDTVIYCGTCGGELERTSHTITAVGHAWDEGTVTTQPGEYTEGEKTFECTSCGTTKTETIPALGHTHSHTSVVTQPTCTEQGYTTYTCKCGDSYMDDYVDATGHTEVIDAAIAATCTETGLTEGKHCEICGEVLVKQETVAATGHSFGEWVTVVEPTEEAEGKAERKCACGEVETKVLEKLESKLPKLGDVNNDGRLNAKDATLILRYSVKKYTDYPDWFEQIADVNDDGRVNAKDATLILRFVVNKADIPGWER